MIAQLMPWTVLSIPRTGTGWNRREVEERASGPKRPVYLQHHAPAIQVVKPVFFIADSVV